MESQPAALLDAGFRGRDTRQRRPIAIAVAPQSIT
jgi:hypothetical protein